MPRVNSVDKCRKSPGQCFKCGTTIEAGQPYKFWAFMVGGRGGPKIIRCGKPECHPKASDLTRSEFWGAIYRLQEEGFSGATLEDLQSERDDMAERVREVGNEQQDKLDNMPDGLRDGDTGNTLQERIDACEEIAGELEGVDIPDGVEWDPDTDKQGDETDEECRARLLSDKLDEVRGELDSALSNFSCS
jgi:hypothetical protein